MTDCTAVEEHVKQPVWYGRVYVRSERLCVRQWHWPEMHIAPVPRRRDAVVISTGNPTDGRTLLIQSCRRWAGFCQPVDSFVTARARQDGRERPVGRHFPLAAGYDVAKLMKFVVSIFESAIEAVNWRHTRMTDVLISVRPRSYGFEWWPSESISKSIYQRTTIAKCVAIT